MSFENNARNVSDPSACQGYTRKLQAKRFKKSQRARGNRARLAPHQRTPSRPEGAVLAVNPLSACPCRQTAASSPAALKTLVRRRFVREPVISMCLKNEEASPRHSISPGQKSC